MKKFLWTAVIILVISTTAANADTWKDSFVTRLMKLMTSEPSYTDVVLTDIDQNGIPEAFLLKKGTNGEIATGITLKDSVLTAIETPKNVTGACLEDITVYDCGTSFVYVGKEVARYAAEIKYFELIFDGNSLLCVPTQKSKYEEYPAIAYKDTFSNDLHTSGYPNRSKIKEFLDSYETPTEIAVKPATANFSVDGNAVNISGFNINGSNYYKIRDIALILRGTGSRFNLSWNSELGLIDVVTGKRYEAIGTELESLTDAEKVMAISSTLIIDGERRIMNAYNVDDSTYFKIRDIGEFAGFDTDWDEITQTIIITTN